LAGRLRRTLLVRIDRDRGGASPLRHRPGDGSDVLPGAAGEPVNVTGRILLVEDHGPSREIMKKALEKVGHVVLDVASGKEAVEQLRGGLEADVVVSDLMMPGMNGMELLKVVKEIDASLGVILVTGHGTVESAVEAMKSGADDYVQKPVNTVE